MKISNLLKELGYSIGNKQMNDYLKITLVSGF